MWYAIVLCTVRVWISYGGKNSCLMSSVVVCLSTVFDCIQFTSVRHYSDLTLSLANYFIIFLIFSVFVARFLDRDRETNQSSSTAISPISSQDLIPGGGASQDMPAVSSSPSSAFQWTTTSTGEQHQQHSLISASRGGGNGGGGSSTVTIGNNAAHSLKDWTHFNEHVPSDGSEDKHNLLKQLYNSDNSGDVSTPENVLLRQILSEKPSTYWLFDGNLNSRRQMSVAIFDCGKMNSWRSAMIKSELCKHTWFSEHTPLCGTAIVRTISRFACSIPGHGNHLTDTHCLELA